MSEYRKWREMSYVVELDERLIHSRDENIHPEDESIHREGRLGRQLSRRCERGAATSH